MADSTLIPVRFQAGDAVEVLDLGKAGHVRTPFYVRHRQGEVLQFCGYFLNPEALSVGDVSGPLVPLYRVRFRMKDLWPDEVRSDKDVLCIEIYDHWLRPATPSTPEDRP